MTEHGSLHILCESTANCPMFGVCVSLYDSCGNALVSNVTDCHGRVVFPILKADEYRIKAITSYDYSPVGQNKMVYLASKCNYYTNFRFTKFWCPQKFGKLIITLRDENYPEYPLSEGEITLWLGKK